MRLLLDTQALRWAVTGDRRLKVSTRECLSRADAVHVSADAASLAGAIDSSGFQELAVSAQHAAAVAKLPPHHTDPFDRLLLAQALLEPLRFVTADGALAVYGGAIEFL